MMRALLAAILIAALAGPVSASPQLRRMVEMELPLWGYDEVDVDALTTGQVAQLHQIMFGDRRRSDKHRLIRSALDGPGLLSRLISRF